MRFDFSDILAPVTPEEFRTRYYDRQPLHIPGSAEKFAGVLDWQRLSDLLNVNALWTAETLQLALDREKLPPAAYCVASDNMATMGRLRPDAALVMKHLTAGASLVLNDVDTATPEIRAIADALEEAFAAKGQCNLYCSWLQRQAFFSHFDTHDVVAIHLLGQKDWRIYANRAPHPINHPLFKGLPEEVHERDRGEVMMAITMKPGDVLYLPRGWYHDALASSEGCVHLTFGLTSVIGLDLVKALGEAAVNDEAFRRNVPADGDGHEAMAAYIADLVGRLVQTAQSPAFREQFERFRDGYR